MIRGRSEPPASTRDGEGDGALKGSDPYLAIISLGFDDVRRILFLTVAVAPPIAPTTPCPAVQHLCHAFLHLHPLTRHASLAFILSLTKFLLRLFRQQVF